MPYRTQTIRSFTLPSSFIDWSYWTIGDYSPTQSRKYAFFIVILIVLGKKKRRPCLLPLNYGFNEENDNGKPQEKTRIRDSCEIALYRIPHRKRQERQKNNVLVNCTTTDANHDRATARPSERTKNETNERQDQKRETEPSHYNTRAAASKQRKEQSVSSKERDADDNYEEEKWGLQRTTRKKCIPHFQK